MTILSTPSNHLSATKAAISKPTHKKASKDRHVKVNGRDRRVRIPVHCAEQIFQLTKVLGHRTSGQTIEWLLQQAEPIVSKILYNTTVPPSDPSSTPLAAKDAPARPPENHAFEDVEPGSLSIHDYSFYMNYEAEFSVNEFVNMSFPMYF
ncbi:Transcription factor TCP22 [Camellia lanceoleosa]|uniref:Transcription factor TCP22 n=1 Tax=Camellia lanceoleosa TaxID=1840588 RepID=A0ACC0F6H0_9ERIC|nr:Transcription factor TCP22 [Camellia lanceoleosa]